MWHIRFSRLAGASLLLLWGPSSIAVGQTQSRPAAPSTPQSPAAKECLCPDDSVEQSGQEVRSIEQDLECQLGDVDARVKEFEMSSPEFGKLQEFAAQRGDKSGELKDQLEALGADAEDIATQVQEAVSGISVDPGEVFVQAGDESGWLGVEIAEVTPEKARDLKLSAVRGVIVQDVEPESPAAKAGLKENDVITQYDGQPVEGTVQFRRLVRETPPGRSVALAVWRGGETQNLTIEVGDRQSFLEKRMKGKFRDFDRAYSFSMPNFNFEMPEIRDWRTPALGISAEDLNPQLGAYFHAPDNAGVLVREVLPGTAAEKAGLKAGDVIIQVDSKPVKTLDDLRAELRGKGGDKPVSLGILRDGSQMTIPVEVQKPRLPEVKPLAPRAQL